MTIPNECVVGCQYRDCTSDFHSEFCPCEPKQPEPALCFTAHTSTTADGTYSNLITAPLSPEPLRAAQAKLEEEVECVREFDNFLAVFRNRSPESVPRHKAKILKVGSFDTHGSPVGWHFDGEGKAVAWEVLADGTGIWCGYTMKELREIAERQAKPELEAVFDTLNAKYCWRYSLDETPAPLSPELLNFKLSAVYLCRKCGCAAELAPLEEKVAKGEDPLRG